MVSICSSSDGGCNGCRDGSVGRASDTRAKDARFEGAEDKFVRVFPSQNCCADTMSMCPTPVCIHTHKNDRVRTLKIL